MGTNYAPKRRKTSQKSYIIPIQWDIKVSTTYLKRYLFLTVGYQKMVIIDESKINCDWVTQYLILRALYKHSNNGHKVHQNSRLLFVDLTLFFPCRNRTSSTERSVLLERLPFHPTTAKPIEGWWFWQSMYVRLI